MYGVREWAVLRRRKLRFLVLVPRLPGGLLLPQHVGPVRGQRIRVPRRQLLLLWKLGLLCVPGRHVRLCWHCQLKLPVVPKRPVQRQRKLELLVLPRRPVHKQHWKLELLCMLKRPVRRQHWKHELLFMLKRPVHKHLWKDELPVLPRRPVHKQQWKHELLCMLRRPVHQHLRVIELLKLLKWDISAGHRSHVVH